VSVGFGFFGRPRGRKGEEKRTGLGQASFFVRPLAVGSDADGDSLSISIGSAAHGTVAVDDNGTSSNPSDDFVTYTSDAGYVGNDSFTFTLSDGHGGAVTKTVHLRVAHGLYTSAVVAASSQSAGSNAIGGNIKGTFSFIA